MARRGNATVARAWGTPDLGGAHQAVLSFIAVIFPEGAERNRELVFFINLPIAISVIAGVLWMLQETRREEVPVDLPAAVLATAALGLTTYMLADTEQHGLFSGRTLLLDAVPAALFFAQRRSAQPLVPFELLRHRPSQTALVGRSRSARSSVRPRSS